MSTRSFEQSLLALQDRLLEGFQARVSPAGVLLGLRLSLALIYLWFGGLKFFHGLSPAEDLAGRTLVKLSLGVLSPHGAVLLLAALECGIGAGLAAADRFLPMVVGLVLAHMAGTFTPVLLFPGEVFTRAPYAMSLEGQYIAKNLVLVAAAVGMLFLLPARRPARAYSAPRVG